MLARILTVTIVTLQLAACASLSAGDPALYQGLADSDVNLASQLCLRSDQMAGFSRIQPRLHWNGHYDTDARDRTRKVGQTRSLIVSSSDANVCVLHDKV